MFSPKVLIKLVDILKLDTQLILNSEAKRRGV